MKKILFAALVITFSSCNMNPAKKTYSAEEIAAESKKVNDFLDRKYDESVARYPETASTLGLKTGYDSWNDRSDAAGDREMEIAKANIDSVKKNYNLEALDEQTKLSVRMLEEDYERAKEGLKWRHYGYELSQMWGVHNDLPSFLINVHKIDSVSDAKAYLLRLQKLPNVFDQALDNLKLSEAKGVIPPYYTFTYVKNDVSTFIAGFDKKDASNVLLADYTTKVDKLNDIDAAQKETLKKQAAETLANEVKASYQKLLTYWLSIEDKAKENGSKGAWSLPNGDAYYADQLKYHTTTTMTPDQIFETGEKEVARIQAEMRGIMKQVQFKSDSVQEFFEFVRSDKQFKYSNDTKGSQDLLDDANRYVEGMRVKLPELFATLPKAPLVVKKVEAFREKSAFGAFYEDPAEDGSRPGRYYVNTYNMADEPKYQMEALTYHEAIPGHHMQIAIAQELKGVPKFRRHEFFTAYVEGWALYAEQLGKEAGMYQDPYSDFGRLSMEIFRAARLVVDVGIHHKHWSREQAIEYMLKNTANAKGDIEHEVERYMLWPGQATGYKTGMIRILELREKAKKELGDKFDIRQFHDVVLTNGAVSLTILEELVNKWVEKTKAGDSPATTHK